MRRRTLLSGLAVTGLMAACDLPHSLDPPPAGTLIVVRHTERTGENLNAAGIARAAALPAALDGIAIDGIYSPERQRNLDTAAPLAEARGLDVQVISAIDIAQTMFKRQPGGTLVWVGNKDNIADLWDEIDAIGTAPILYGDLFIVSMEGLKATSIDRRHFGI